MRRRLRTWPALLAVVLFASLALPATASAQAVNTVPPSIEGTPRDGQILVGHDGTWNTPILTSLDITNRQWRRCDTSGNNCTDIPGATSANYLLTPADVGHRIRYRVTARSCGLICSGTSTAESAATQVVRTDPSNDVAPVITGNLQEGSTLSIQPGTNVWSGFTAVDLTFQWRRCDVNGNNCANIGGATGSTYTVTDDDIGSRIRVRVTGTNDHGSVSVDSAPTGVIGGNAPVAAGPVSFSGTLRHGETLTANDTTFTGTQPITVSRRWQRCDTTDPATCDDIPGATGTTYVLTQADVGKRIRRINVATNTAAPLGVVAASPISTPVLAAPPAPVPGSPPVISGTFANGETLSHTNGSFTGTTPFTFTRQWQRCDTDQAASCSNIPGATNPTYTLTGADVGKRIRVVVTADNTAGDASHASAIVGPVGGTAPQVLTQPSFSGTLQDGETLTATDATFSGTPTPTIDRVWQRCTSTQNPDVNCANIPGTQGDIQYTLTGADVGFRIRFVNSASNGVGTAFASTAVSAPVAGDPPSPNGSPSITGTLRHGETLTATDTTFSGTQPITVTRRWQRCDTADPATCDDILPAQTGTTYVLQQADVGKRIRVVNVATNTAAPLGVSQPSAITGVVAPAAPQPVPGQQPTITGTFQEGEQLTATNGSFTGTTPFTFTRQWQRCQTTDVNSCANIPGATGVNYTVQAADVNRRLRVLVTAENSAGDATHASPIFGPVGGTPPAVVTQPSFTGTLVEGQTLTGTDGTFSGNPAPTVDRVWQRCTTTDPATCQNIPNTQGDTQYTLIGGANGDVGRRIRYVNSADNGVPPAAFAATNISGTVQAAQITPPTPDPGRRPSITGTMIDGRIINGFPGGFTGTPPTSYTYKFQRCDADGSNCADIPGAEVDMSGAPATHGLTTSSVGKRIRLSVVAHNAGGSSQEVLSPLSAVVARNRPPVARFSASPESPLIGQQVTFTSSSSDPDGDALTYAWDIDGDGQFDDGNRSVQSVTYSTPGNRNVSLRVTSPGGSDEVFVSVPVRDLPPDPPPRAISPFPRISVHGRAFRTGTRVTVFRITAPRGTSIDARCSRSRNCPFRRVRGRITARNTRVRAFQRTFRPGARIEIRLTQRGRIGKWMRVQFRTRRAPLMTHRCLFPGSSRVRRCPRGVR
jgi:hypothetical protein